MNPHEILGVSPGASDEDIKKAYKRLAMEWHPDRHGGDPKAEEKFKEINAAYQVLTGKAKGEAQPFVPNPTDEEVFDFFRQGFRFGDMFSSVFGPFARRSGQPHLSMAVSLEEACGGGRKTIRFTRQDKCPNCGGHGREIGMEDCPSCGGTGKSRTSSSTSGNFTIFLTCQVCAGLGKRLGNPCDTCHGAGSVSSRRETTVDIPPGVMNGETLAAADGSRVTVHYARHPHLTLVPGTLNTENEIEVGIFDMLLGAEADVRTLAGNMRVKIEPGLRPGSRLRVRGAGMLGRGGARGDHVVRVWASMPRLSEEQRGVLAKARAGIEGEQK